MKNVLSVSLARALRSWACMLLCLLLVFALQPSAAFAEGETVYISSAEQLCELSQLCVLDSYSRGKRFELTSDISVSGTGFTPIPIMAGTFDGNGHSISGFAVSADASVTGLFRQVAEGGRVEDLKVFGSVRPGGSARSIGGITGLNSGTLSGCSFVGDVEGIRCVGGIAGVNAESGVIEYCEAYGSVNAQHRTGGIAGENSGTLLGCVNRASVNIRVVNDVTPDDADITLSAEELIDITDIGGISGYTAGTLQSCVNEGGVGYTHAGYNIGGVAGRQAGLVKDCVNKGFVRGRKDVGGITGQLDPDAAWNYTREYLNELKARLDALQTEVDRLSSDAAAQSRALSSDLGEVLDAMNMAGSAADTLYSETGVWMNENIAAVNELSRRVSEGLEGMVPVTEELVRSLADFSDAFADIKAAVDDLRLASDQADSALYNVSSAIGKADAALGAVRTASGNVSGAASAFISSPDAVNLSALLSAVQTDLPAAISGFSSLSGAWAELQNAIPKMHKSSEYLDAALSMTSRASGSLETAFSALSKAAAYFSELDSKLAAYPELRFSELDVQSAAKEELLSSLRSADGALKRISERSGGAVLAEDIHAVSDRLFDVIDYLIESLSEGGTSIAESLEDVSALGQSRSKATISGSSNTGSVEAETNAGGVVGAISIDLDFDRDDELNVSSLVSGGARYIVYAALRDCSSSASVSAGKTAAGGIAGRMDYGALFGCEASGTISAYGDYAGGIAGISLATIKDCRARVGLSAGNYAGGIAGQGRDISGCLSMPYFDSACEFMGSVAGDADGSVSGNFYSQSAAGAVNGFSFSGQGEPAAHEQLIEKSQGSQIFSTISVSFVVEGETVEVRDIPFGGKVDDLPKVADKNGKSWKWNDEGLGAVYSSIVVEGRYVSPVTTLSTGGEIPEFLVQGSFYEGQVLIAADMPSVESAAAAGALGIAAEDVLKACSLSVNGSGLGLTVRMRTEEDGTLYCGSAQSGFEERQYERDGSYIVFEMEDGASLIYAKSRRSRMPLLAAGGGAAALAALAAVFTVRSRRRKKSAEGSGEDS